MDKENKIEDEVVFSIFKYNLENFPLYIKKCVVYCIEDNGIKMDIPKLVKHLGFKVQFVQMKDKAVIEHEAGAQIANLYINETLELAEKNAIAVLIISEYLLRYQEGRGKRIAFDVFYLDSIKRAKMSKHIFLATRLAIPEKKIDELDEFNSDKSSYSQISNLPMYFLDLAKKRSSVEAYLSMTEGKSSDWLNSDW